MTSPDPHQIVAEIKRQGRLLGFDLVGIAPATASVHADYVRAWLNDGRHGQMDWLERRVDERLDPARYLPGCRSVICCAINYFVPLTPPQRPATAGRVARYALGDDYHVHLKRRLFALSDWIRERHPDVETKAATDTAPVLERELAGRSGVGWVGKNTCLLNERIGSWLLLGQVLTTLDLPPDTPAQDRCGTCRRCLDACPTHALSPDTPYRLDASKCISYLTIEHRQGDLPPEYHRPIGDWLFGCDICQDVCPWNRRAPSATDPALQPRVPSGTLDVDEVLGWTAEDFRAATAGTAIRRIKLPVLQRNARIARENLRIRHLGL